MNVTTVQVRDHSKETVQLVTRTRPGAYFGVSLLRTLNYIFQADNELTPSRVLKALYKMEPFTKYGFIKNSSSNLSNDFSWIIWPSGLCTEWLGRTARDWKPNGRNISKEPIPERTRNGLLILPDFCFSPTLESVNTLTLVSYTF
jgi:hypothetical protein